MYHYPLLNIVIVCELDQLTCKYNLMVWYTRDCCDHYLTSRFVIFLSHVTPLQPGLSTAGAIFTYAGNGMRGVTGDGRQATTAFFESPQGMSVDSVTGNLYVVDTYRVLRMINKTTGIITCVAGGGYTKSRGDGGLAVLATLFASNDVAIDPLNGNIYITDYSTIRMVTKITGIITTIAGNSARSGYAGDGGLATLATLSSPKGIDVDPNTGDLYIADSRNHAVRMIKRSTGIISTIAGTGEGGYAGDGGPATSAKLNVPYSVMLDASSSMMYIADQNNYVVRNIVLTPTTAVYSPSMAPTGTGIVK